MGTTSEKLTYLNTTKGKIKDSINLTGANITTEPFRQYSTKLEDAYIDIINNGTDTLYNNFPKVSGEGTSLTLNNTYQAPMRNNLKGNTSQITTTQSSNLFDENKYLTETFTTGTYKYALANFKGNRTLYCKSQLKTGKTAISGLYVAIATNGTNPSNTGQTKYAIFNGNVSAGDTSKDFTGYDNLYIAYYPTSKTWEEILDVYDIWVSTNDVNYTPFVPNSPSPDYPQDVNVVSGDNSIVVCGENLWKDSQAYGLYLLSYSDGVYSASDNDNRSTLFYKIQQYNSSGNVISGSGLSKSISNTGFYYFTLTRVENATNFRISNNGQSMEFKLFYPLPDFIKVGDKFTVAINIIDKTIGASKFKEVMLMLGEVSSATYTPYQTVDTYPINLPIENLLDTSTNTRQGYINSSGTFVSNVFNIISDYIPVDFGETYTLSYKEQIGVMAVSEFDSNKTFITRQQASNKQQNSFTLSNNTKYVIVGFSNSSSIQATPEVWVSYEPQFEKGSKVNSYTPYGTTPIEMCKIGNYQDQFKKATGKNLAPINLESETYNSLQITNNNNGTFTLYGNPTGSFGRDIATNLTLKAGTYTISANAMPSGLYIALDNEADTQLSSGTLSKTFTLASDTTYTSLGIWFTKNKDYDVTIQLQIEEGSSVTEWQPMNGWYKEQQVKKVKISDLTWYYASTNAYFYSVVEDILVEQTSTMFKGYSNIYKSVDSASTSNWANKPNNSIGMRNTYNYLCVKDTAYTDTTNFTTNRGEGIVYYTLATPTSEGIPSNLINQLEEFYQAQSKNNQTNISQINNDLGFIISASALKKG